MFLQSPFRIILLLFIIAIIILPNYYDSRAESETVLVLDKPPTKVTEEEIIVFTGNLKTKEGRPVQGAQVFVHGVDAIGNEYSLSGSLTDSQGRYGIVWRVEHLAKSLQVFVILKDLDGYTRSQSEEYTLNIVARPQDVESSSENTQGISNDALWQLLGKYGSDCNEIGINKAKLFFSGSFVRTVNLDTKKLDDDGLRDYAKHGFFEPDDPNTGYSRLESIYVLRDYLEKCGVDSNNIVYEATGVTYQISEKTQLALDYAEEYARENGREIPFTGEPILDTLILMSFVVGSGIGLRYAFGRFTHNLFYK